jgi:hypothetical protein
MGGEISIKDKGPGKTGTCIGFNVFMKMGGIHEQHDIEEGSSSSQCCIGASAFGEANNSLEGGGGVVDTACFLFMATKHEECCNPGWRILG